MNNNNNKQVTKLLQNKLIEPSQSNYNSPLTLVPKKSPTGEKRWRMCVDYRILNKNLVPDKFPLPRIEPSEHAFIYDTTVIRISIKH